MNILVDLQQELELLFDDLNWTFILIYVFVLYGVKHKSEFKWYLDLLERMKIQSFKVWIAGIIVGGLFVLFEGLEDNLEAAYISQILRSYIIVIVFNSIFDKELKKIDNDD